MEYPPTPNKKALITISSFFTLLISTSNCNVLHNSVGLPLEACEFPAIFNFGDSNSDTGGLAASFVPPNSPYGMSYDFHMPNGRYSDGRLLIDFIAKSLNVPYLSAYLNSLGTNFTQGANFATASATITLPDIILPTNDGYSPFYLSIQYSQFLQFLNRSHMIRKQGGVFAKLIPKEEYFAKALYTFDIGQNDLGEIFSANMSLEDVKSSVASIIDQFSITLKNIYHLGARAFWIHNTGPIGCLQYIFTKFPTAERDSAGCSKPHNEVAKYFNHKLREAVSQLRVDLPSASFTYVDVYSVKYSLFTEPAKYGFELPLVACCGYGSEYNYSSKALCGTTIKVNGTDMVVGACDRPSVRVIWEGIHYTEAASNFIFNQISSGKFSDPPVPLKLACHKGYETVRATTVCGEYI